MAVGLTHVARMVYAHWQHRGLKEVYVFMQCEGANYNKPFSTLDRQLPTTRARRSRRGKWFHTSFGPIGGVQLFTYQRLQGGAGVVGVWWVAEKQ